MSHRREVIGSLLRTFLGLQTSTDLAHRFRAKMRFIPNIIHFRSFVEDGWVRMRVTNWKLRVKSVLKKGSKLSNKFKRGLPLQVSRVCLFIGSLPYPVGIRNSTVIPNSNYFRKWVTHECKDPVVKERWNHCNRVTVTGGYNTSIINIQEMASLPTTKGLSYEDLLRGLNFRASDLRLPRLPMPEPIMSRYVRLKGSSFPGHLTSN
jgi:hypothetical protein